MSVYRDILAGVAGSLAAVEGAGTPLVRDYPITIGTEAPPLLYVSPMPTGERVLRRLFGGWTWWGYPVLVTLVLSGNRQVEDRLDHRLDLRQAIRAALDRPLLDGVAAVWDAEIDPQVSQDLQAAIGTNYAVSGWLMTYKTVERRTSAPGSET